MRALAPAIPTPAPLPAAPAATAQHAFASLRPQRRMTAAGACWVLLCYVALTAWDEHRIRLARARDARARKMNSTTPRPQRKPAFAPFAPSCSAPHEGATR